MWGGSAVRPSPPAAPAALSAVVDVVVWLPMEKRWPPLPLLVGTPPIPIPPRDEPSVALRKALEPALLLLPAPWRMLSAHVGLTALWPRPSPETASTCGARIDSSYIPPNVLLLAARTSARSASLRGRTIAAPPTPPLPLPRSWGLRGCCCCCAVLFAA